MLLLTTYEMSTTLFIALGLSIILVLVSAILIYMNRSKSQFTGTHMNYKQKNAFGFSTLGKLKKGPKVKIGYARNRNSVSSRNKNWKSGFKF